MFKAAGSSLPVIILAGSHQGLPVYITALSRTAAGAQVCSDMFSACNAFIGLFFAFIITLDFKNNLVPL